MTLDCNYEETNHILAEADDIMDILGVGIMDILGVGIFHTYDAAGGKRVVNILCPTFSKLITANSAGS